MIRTLLIEDDPIIRKIITYYLAKESAYDVVSAENAGDALYKARDKFDVILLDIMLPDVDGISICAKLREIHDCPIIFISCLDDSDTIVRALESGGDDFLVKPFDNKVLVAKIQANLRRYHAALLSVDNQLSCPDFTLDATTHTIHMNKNGHTIKLAQTEYRILSLLMQYPNTYFSGEEIYKKIWGNDSYGDARTVTVHIHNLRSKIEDNISDPKYLKNEWKKGYVFCMEETK